MTFSVVGRCARTGQVGIAISSSSPAVAARCAHVRAGVGAVASQNVTDPRLGPLLLDRVAAGVAPRAAIEAVRTGRAGIEHRQLMAVDAAGRVATWSGRLALGLHAAAEGEGCAAAGNLLSHVGVPRAMVDAFAAAPGELGARLLAALLAGRDAGGEAGPVHSAGLLVAHDQPWPLTDLRVDWDDTDPIGRLADLWSLWAPQQHAYIGRALDPDAAPSYGVPGDE